jgi:hypothetical protein
LSAGKGPIPKPQPRRSRPLPAVAPQAPIVASNASNALLNAFIALILFGFAAFGWTRLDWPPVVDPNARDFNPFLVLALVMTAAGAWYAFKAIRDGLRVRKFETSVLDVDEAFVGVRLRGKVRTTRDLAPTGSYTLTVRAIETVASKSIHMNQPEGVVHNDHLLWETQRIVLAPDVRSSQGIPFDIPLPAELPPSGGDSAVGAGTGVRWVLAITAPTAGLDYNALFLLEVKARGENGS